MGLMVLGVLLVLVVLIAWQQIPKSTQAHAYILERLGGYKETWGVGIHFEDPDSGSCGKESITQRAGCRF